MPKQATSKKTIYQQAEELEEKLARYQRRSAAAVAKYAKLADDARRTAPEAVRKLVAAASKIASTTQDAEPEQIEQPAPVKAEPPKQETAKPKQTTNGRSNGAHASA